MTPKALARDFSLWKCPNGHVLGVVQRVRFTRGAPGSRLRYRRRRLLLLRHGMPNGMELSGTVFMILVSIALLNWRCDVAGCECRRSWLPDADPWG